MKQKIGEIVEKALEEVNEDASEAFACTVWPGTVGTSPATIPNTSKPERIFAIPLPILFFLIMCILLLHLFVTIQSQGNFHNLRIMLA